MTKHSYSLKSPAALIASVALIGLVATGSMIWKSKGAQAKPAPASAPATSVSVHTVKEQKTRVWSSFSGRIAAVDYAAIRPEVSGRIIEIRFKDGQTVKAHDILMVIDPQPYEAAVSKAEANLASAKTKGAFAKTEFDRAENLIKTEAIAQRVYDERANGNRIGQADIKAAEAELKKAKIDLDRAYVKAPFSGRIGRAEITLGNLVQAGQNAPVLTSIVSDNGIYADFEVDEQTYMNNIRAHAATQRAEQAIPVELTVQGDKNHPYKGSISSFDNHIDNNSGTIRARSKFSNEDGALMPGMFVSIKLASSTDETVILVPERAIGNDQNKRFVFVVDSGRKVVYREVRLGKEAGEGQRIVLSGLASGDKVIVDGLQHVKPDMVVDAKEL